MKNSFHIHGYARLFQTWADLRSIWRLTLRRLFTFNFKSHRMYWLELNSLDSSQSAEYFLAINSVGLIRNCHRTLTDAIFLIICYFASIFHIQIGPSGSQTFLLRHFGMDKPLNTILFIKYNVNVDVLDFQMRVLFKHGLLFAPTRQISNANSLVSSEPM